VAAEHPPICMEFVDDHEAQVLEELLPPRVVGEDSLVEHVGIGHHQVPLGPDRLAGVGRGVAVVSEGLDIRPEGVYHTLEFVDLILAQRLCRKEVERPGRGIFQNGLKYRNIVAEGLAGGCGGHHHHIAAFEDVIPCQALLDEGPLDSS